MDRDPATPPWIIDALRRRREERAEQPQPRLELPLPAPDQHHEREERSPGSTVVVIELWG